MIGVDGEAIPIAVVVPTYNRAAALITCLEHLERQSWREFEVVVVDDGSTDGTAAAMEEYARRTPLRLRYVRQENAGPARARNRAIAMLEAPVCLMIGDDIFADGRLVETHLRFHREWPEERIAGLGLTWWSEEGQRVTRFMRWLDDTGLQFSYRAMLQGKKPGWAEFFTSNLSVKTALLRRNRFDERFPAAAMEDIELGYRLERREGLKVEFLPEALAWHLHPTTFAQACRRLEGVGRATYLFHEIWPEHRPEATRGLTKVAGNVFFRSRWMLNVLRRGTDLLARVWCPNPLLGPVLRLHSSAGYRSARRRGGSGLP